jgi:hypothetical protein
MLFSGFVSHIETQLKLELCGWQRPRLALGSDKASPTSDEAKKAFNCGEGKAPGRLLRLTSVPKELKAGKDPLSFRYMV